MMLKRYSKKHIAFWSSAYILPFPALVIYTIAVLAEQGLITFMAGFIGTFIMGAMLLSPFFCIYYAGLTFIHTIIDECVLGLYSKKKSVINILISFACSIFLVLSSIWTIHCLDNEFRWLPIVLMIMGFAITGVFLAVRMIFLIVKTENKV